MPSLLVQLEAFAADRAHDRYLELGLKPADALTDGRRRVHPPELLPRAAAADDRRLSALRRAAGAARAAVERPGDVDAAARRFATDDLRDLQVWQKLAWIDPSYLERDPRVAGARRERRATSPRTTRRLLRAVELELLNAVIPAYRRARRGGTDRDLDVAVLSPDSAAAVRYGDLQADAPELARCRGTGSCTPRMRSSSSSGRSACHERLFGRRPVGLWPSEGSVSDAMVPLVAQAGFKWMATDELILARTLGIDLQPRRPRARRSAGAAVSRRTVVAAGGAAGRLRVPRPRAVGPDRVRLRGLGAPTPPPTISSRASSKPGRRGTAQDGGEEPTIFVILDGENAWEHFEGGGRPFLRALYRRLAAHPELRTVTMAEACAAPARDAAGHLSRVVDRRELLHLDRPCRRPAGLEPAGRGARGARRRRPGRRRGALAQAREEMLIAEGSDWFWWYGDDHSSDHDLEFDDLFRRHLRNVYRLLQRPVPDELFVSNIIDGRARADCRSDADRADSPDARRRGVELLRMAGAGDAGGPRGRRARCTRPTVRGGF